jgi:hypothetical protein
MLPTEDLSSHPGDNKLALSIEMDSRNSDVQSFKWRLRRDPSSAEEKLGRWLRKS